MERERDSGDGGGDSKMIEQRDDDGWVVEWYRRYINRLSPVSVSRDLLCLVTRFVVPDRTGVRVRFFACLNSKRRKEKKK